tara:strand:+ start:1657 stop:3519 length:1863 start_codon:yes stop_codon:yes gene_type:complete
MPFAKFQFKAGIDKEGTNLTNAGGWFDASLVRFRKGFAEKIGGWTKQTSATFLGTCRKLFPWISLEGAKYLFVGTHLKANILEGNTLADITPIRKTSTNSITFAATNGSATITATDSSHGAVIGDFVTISGAVSLGGNITASVLNQEHQIVSVPTANTYTFTASATANSSDTGNGGSGVDGAYQLNTGLDVFIQSSGWGSGAWGASGFGASTSLSFTNQLRLWSADNFGEDLILHARGGGIFYWDESNGTSTRAVNITSLSGSNLAPTIGFQTIVSDTDRHVIVLGADPISSGSRTGVLDPMLVVFSDQESITEFEPKTTNTAGSVRLSAGSEIRGGIRARQEILIWTDTSMYSMQFVGPPLTFALNLINEGTGMIGPNAAINSPAGVFWMSDDGFYSYTGSVQKLPCSVLSYIQEDLDISQAFKVFALLNKEYNEVWWFYPAESDGTSEISRYVIYNYLEGVWSIGQLVRTAWVDQNVFARPLATNSGVIFAHEDGEDDDGLPMDNVFIESADFDLQDGNDFAFIRRMMPDIRFYGTNVTSGGPQINMLLKTRNAPSESLTTRATKDISNNTAQVHVRARGRQAVLRVQSDDDAATGNRLGVKWRLGYTRLDVQPDGKR